jgi:hypothetical protein
VDEVKPVARVPTVEHREPCESRGSRTVLGAPGGEIPPGDSTRPTKLMVSKTSPLNTRIADIGADILFRRLGPIAEVTAPSA